MISGIGIGIVQRSTFAMAGPSCTIISSQPIGKVHGEFRKQREVLIIVHAQSFRFRRFRKVPGGDLPAE